MKRITASDALFFIFILIFGCIYLYYPQRYYDLAYLQNFDYGILFNTTELVSRGQAPFITSRGVYAWADNQDYLAYLLSLLHYFPNPHRALILAHSLVIFASGIICYFMMRARGILAVVMALFVWLSPFMLNMNTDLIHTEAFATFFLLLTFYGLLNNCLIIYYLGLSLALVCKEDVALTALVFCLAGLLSKSTASVFKPHLVIGMVLSVALFSCNQFVVLPMSKVLSCEYLGFDYSQIRLKGGPIAPWFSDVWSNVLSWHFWEQKFFLKQTYSYLLALFWPLIILLRRVNYFFLVPLPGAFINIVGGGYLIQGAYHYDHSSFAGVVIAAISALYQEKNNLGVSVTFIAAALYSNLVIEPVRPRITELFERKFWVVDQDARVAFFDFLQDNLPSDVGMSADYTIINYVFSGRSNVYMFENPFRADNFGIYGVCDGYSGSSKLPRSDIVLHHKGYDITGITKKILNEQYERYQVDIGAQVIFIYIHQLSKYYKKLRSVVEAAKEHEW